MWPRWASRNILDNTIRQVKFNNQRIYLGISVDMPALRSESEAGVEFTLRQLQYFIAAADAGTISAAADSMHVSASALSAAITDLERVLDVQLCVRRKAHGLALTPSGQQVYEQARSILRAATEIQHSASAPSGELSGPVTVGCYLTLAPTVLPKVLAGFGELHERVQVNMVEGSQNELLESLAAGDIDVAVVYDMQISGNPNRVRLYSVPAHILIPADHPRADQETISLEDLEPEPFILFDVPPSTTHTMALFTGRGLQPRVRHRSKSYETVRALVGRGLGYSVLVQRPRNNHSYEGRPLLVKEITPPVPQIVVYMIWAEGVHLSSRARALVKYAKTIDWSASI